MPDIFLNVRLHLSGKYARPTGLHPDHSIAGCHALTRFVRKGMSGHSTELPVPAGYWLGLSGDGPGPKGRKTVAGGEAAGAPAQAAQPPVTDSLADQRQCRDWPMGLARPADGVILRRGYACDKVARPQSSPHHREQDQFRAHVQALALLVRGTLSGGCAAHGCAVLRPRLPSLTPFGVKRKPQP